MADRSGHAMSPEPNLFLADGTRSQTGLELKALLTRGLEDAVRQEALAPGTERIARQLRAVLERCEFVLDGADITSGSIDLTGLALSAMIDDGDAPPPADVSDSPDSSAVTAREGALLRRLTLRAAPVLIDGVPLSIDGEVRDVRLEWLETASGKVGLHLTAFTTRHPLRGYLRLSAPKEEALRGLSAFIAASIEREGVRVSRLDIDVRSSGPRQLSLAARAKVRKGVLAGKVRVLGSVEIDDSLILRFSELSITSANPVLATLIGLMRRDLKELESETVDLKDALPPGSRVTQLEVAVGREMSFALALG